MKLFIEMLIVGQVSIRLDRVLRKRTQRKRENVGTA